jgi:hypothetical protein
MAAKKYKILSDKTISEGILYRLAFIYHWVWSQFFYGAEVLYDGNKGLEPIPKDFPLRDPKQAALLIGMHSTHNSDILVGMLSLFEVIGRVSRGLMHTVLFWFVPWVARLGLLPGTRENAVQLLVEGSMCGVLPGGGEEAMSGHENAYLLHPRWTTRRGFVVVAREAAKTSKKPIYLVPYFCKNVEEMRFNPFFYVFNKLGLSRFYMEKLVTLPGKAGWIFKQIGSVVWYNVAFLSIPVPVKITFILGKPILPKWDEESDDVIAEKCKDGLMKLIQKYQPHGHAYLPGLIERWDYLKRVQAPRILKKYMK